MGSFPLLGRLVRRRWRLASNTLKVLTSPCVTWLIQTRIVIVKSISKHRRQELKGRVLELEMRNVLLEAKVRDSVMVN